MASKTLTIKESTYNKIKRTKRAGESFSDLFERTIAKNQSSIMKYAGILTDKEADKMSLKIKEYRKLANKSSQGRMKHMRDKIR